MRNNDLTLQTFIEISKKMEKKEKNFKKPEIFHYGMSASAISEFFALALTNLEKSCTLARAQSAAQMSGAHKALYLCSTLDSYIVTQHIL